MDNLASMIQINKVVFCRKITRLRRYLEEKYGQRNVQQSTSSSSSSSVIMTLEEIKAVLDPKKRGGLRESVVKLTEDHKERLCKLAIDPATSSMTVRQMRDCLYKADPDLEQKRISLSHLNAVLLKMNITLKKATVVAREGLNETNLAKRREYVSSYFTGFNYDSIGRISAVTEKGAIMNDTSSINIGSSMIIREEDSATSSDDDHHSDSIGIASGSSLNIRSELEDQRYWTARFDPRQFLFTDESGFNCLSNQRRKARSLKGCQAIVSRRYVTGKNHSLLIATALLTTATETPTMSMSR